jgi:hypothetical protein
MQKCVDEKEKKKIPKVYYAFKKGRHRGSRRNFQTFFPSDKAGRAGL